MNALHPEPRGRAVRPPSPELEVLELPLLLHEAHFAAVEVAARGRGLTAAELVRGIIRDFLRREGQAAEGARGNGLGTEGTDVARL
jgi:hypothetical protein